MVGDACRFGGWTARWLDQTGYSEQRRHLELWSLHVFEHSQSRGALAPKSRDVLGNGAAGNLRRARTRTCRTGDCDEAEMAFRHRSALELVALPGGDCDVDVGGSAAEDMEQHAY